MSQDTGLVNVYNPHIPNIDAISGALFRILWAHRERPEFSMSMHKLNDMRAPEMASKFGIWGLLDE